MNMDPNFVNNYRLVVNNLWQSVFARYYSQLTSGEVAIVQQRFNNDCSGLVNQLIQMQQQQGGTMPQQNVEMFLDSYIKQVVQQIRTSNPMGAFGNGIPINTGFGNMGMPAPAPMYGPGFNMGRPMNNFGMPMGGMMTPMNNFGMPAYNAPAAPNVSTMPSVQAMQMASMYGMKAPQPPMQPQVPAQAIPTMTQPPAQPSFTPPPVNATIPETKITVDIVPYQNPMANGNAKTLGKAPNKYGVSEGKFYEFVNSANSKLNVVSVTLDKWVKTIHSKVAELVEALKPNFLIVKHKTYSVVDIYYSTLSKTFLEMKSVLQKAKAAEQSYTSFEMLEMALHVLADKSNGCAKFVERIVINRFNQLAFSMDLGKGAFIVDSVDKIVSFKDTVKDAKIMGMIDYIIFDIIDNVLSEITVYDPASAEVEEYLKDTICTGGRTYKDLKANDADGFKAWCKANSVVVSNTKTTVWTDLSFDQTFSPIDNESFEAVSKPTIMDDSPIDTDLEYFIKTVQDLGNLSNIIINHENVAMNYFICKTEDNVYMRKASMY